jgi:TPP-dependent pyruvate/acetoin dehydrogenase alpha subunit
MTKDELIAFEESIAAEFNAGKIPYPIHLDNGNEYALIDVFKSVKPQDWVFGSWRLHYKALLKGVPPEELRAAIRRGESMALRFDEHRVYGSAIVGGTVPIALGTALAIKRRGGNEHVWLFVGDMVAESGILHEAIKYAENFDLPMTVVVEDNGVSVCTDTREVWGIDRPIVCNTKRISITHYKYTSKYPHAGAGQRVQF